MIKFTIVKGVLQVKWQDLTIPIFNEIYQRDTTKEKKWADAMLRYIFHMADQTDDNTFKDLPYYKKEESARKAALVKLRDFTDEEKYYTSEGIVAYLDHNSTVDLRSLETYNKTIDKMLLLIEANPPEMIRYQEPVPPGTPPNPDGTLVTGKVSWVTNTKIINDTLKDINLVTEARDKVNQRLNKGVANSKNKGGYEKSASEKGLISAPGAAAAMSQEGGN